MVEPQASLIGSSFLRSNRDPERSRSHQRGSCFGRNLELPAMVQATGRALFLGTVAQRNALLREFRNFVRQAKTYDSGAVHIGGSSAALLSYYAVLNLAKADLRSAPTKVRGVRIHHGLSFNPARARTVARDAVYVQDGVFPLLYQKRTGRQLAIGTRLPVRRLLASVPEIGWELREAGLDPSIGNVHASRSCVRRDRFLERRPAQRSLGDAPQHNYSKNLSSTVRRDGSSAELARHLRRQ